MRSEPPRLRIARALVEHLPDHTRDGRAVAPGTKCGLVLEEPDGRALVVTSQGESLELLWSRDEAHAVMTGMACSGTMALKLAWFIVWSWWVKASWFGVKHWLWRWAVLELQRWA